MIPVGPILWVLVYLLRKNKDSGQPELSGRSVLLALLWLPLYSCLGGIFALPLILAAEVFGGRGVDAAGPGLATGYLLAAPAMLCGPRWLAFRVLRRVPFLARCAYWFALFSRSTDQEGLRRALQADLRRPLFPPEDPLRRPPLPTPPFELDAWALAALAIEADDAGELSRAQRLVRALARLPRDARFPRDARVFALDALAWRAARRGDWPALQERAALARGRGAWLAAAVARAHLASESPARLWSLWLLAPRRLQRLPVLRVALAACGRPRAPEPARIAARGPVAQHLALAGAAREGRPALLDSVARLAAAWEERLTPEHEARFLARGRELGARDPEGAWRELRDTLAGELLALAAGAEGHLAAFAGPGLPAEMQARLRARLHDDLAEEAATWNSDRPRDLGHPAPEYERWLAFRERVERLEAAGGLEELRTAWFGGVRLCAWNWPCHLLDLWQGRVAWPCLAMFTWAADLAARVGDGEAERVNRKNVGAARSRLT